jgi:hypothetical protein
VTRLERRIAELAEATGKTVYVGRQGWKDEWFAGCASPSANSANTEGYGSSAERALDALVDELRTAAENAEREALSAANQA